MGQPSILLFAPEAVFPPGVRVSEKCQLISILANLTHPETNRLFKGTGVKLRIVGKCKKKKLKIYTFNFLKRRIFLEFCALLLKDENIDDIPISFLILLFGHTSESVSYPLLQAVNN